MMAKAYVLIRTAPGLTKAVHSSLRISPVVKSVEMVTGPYDLIVAMEADSTNEILKTIMNDVRPAAGIRDTLTCIVVPDADVAGTGPVADRGDRSEAEGPTAAGAKMSG